MDICPHAQKAFVLLDGAMGTMLQKKGLKPGQSPELIALTNPEWLTETHTAYQLSLIHIFRHGRWPGLRPVRVTAGNSARYLIRT